MEERIENANKIDGLPVILCDEFIYPGMKTILHTGIILYLIIYFVYVTHDVLNSSV